MQNTIQFPPALMRVKEAAQYLAMSPRTVATLTARGTLSAVRFGKRCVRYRRADLDALVAQRAG